MQGGNAVVANDDFPPVVGPPSEPVEIDFPYLGACRAYTSHLYHPNGSIMKKKNCSKLVARIVVPLVSSEPAVPAKYAYWLIHSVKDALYGKVYKGRLLKLRETEDESSLEWTYTDIKVAIKMLNLEKITRLQERGGENPFDEISVMQTLQRHIEAGIQGVDMVNGDIEEIMAAKEAALRNNRIMTLLDALTDDEHVFAVMPFCDGGELFDVVSRRYHDNGRRYSEEEARYWFRQMLTAIEALQQNELCHRDISLENMITTSDGLSIVIDFGMCLKVPYIEENGVRRRCLITLDNTNWGKPYYKAPELVANEPFDGFAVDVWALGPILFLMTFGFPPWEHAAITDKKFQFFSNGQLARTLHSWNMYASDELVDLLQGMFWRDPRRRLSLSQVREHAWVNGPVTLPTER